MRRLQSQQSFYSSLVSRLQVAEITQRLVVPSYHQNRFYVSFFLDPFHRLSYHFHMHLISCY
ncbi:hypothetical protein HanIR_Chr16g0793681 [Helianthus annuus]|nr:hypothetical protein HanIR_Chr16g0793681 [Helianthus annuus]